MKLYRMQSIIQVVFLWLLISSCQNKELKDPSKKIQITFENKFGDQALELNKKYTNLNKDEIDLNRLSYYVSNIQLKNTKGDIWKEYESYHLINITAEGGNKITFELDSLPEDEYSTIYFSIGIDPTRNSKGAQTGDLDPLNGMFWTWQQGYVFLKSEGYYYNKTPVSKGGMVFHVGNNENYRTIQLNFDKKNIQEMITVSVDVQKIFGGFDGASIQLKAPNNDTGISIMGGSNLGLIADNYAKMFVVSSVK